MENRLADRTPNEPAARQDQKKHTRIVVFQGKKKRPRRTIEGRKKTQYREGQRAKKTKRKGREKPALEWL